MNCCVTDLQIFIIPNVAINGGSLPNVTRTPVNSPSATPTKRPTNIPIIYAGTPVIPAFARSPVLDPSMKIITIAPIATSVEPTAKSIPPVIMTNVIPNAIIPIVALFLRILIQFLDHIANHAPNDPWLKPSANV